MPCAGSVAHPFKNAAEKPRSDGLGRAVLAPWHIRSQNPCFSQNGCATEPAQLLSPDSDNHQVDKSVRASDCAGSLVSQFEDEERKGRSEGPFSLSFGDRGGITHVSLKGVCEHAQTREPAQAGDVEAKEQYSNRTIKYINNRTGTDGFRFLCHQFSPSSLPHLANCISRCNACLLKRKQLRQALLPR